MTKIAVVHPDLTTKGGAESVCANVLDALQDEYDLHLLTLTEPDFDELNGYFDTEIDDVTVSMPKLMDIGVRNLTTHLSRLAGVAQLNRLEVALLNRIVAMRQDEFDLVLATRGECPVEINSIQYVHFPVFCKSELSLEGETFDSLKWKIYDKLVQLLSGVSAQTFTNQNIVLLTNSGWTADIIKEVYTVRPRVVYPPVNAASFNRQGNCNEAPGFVTIGRIGADKNIMRCIDIVSELRSQGHDVTLHIVGPQYNEKYVEEVKARTRDKCYVHLKGEVNHDQLVDLLVSNSYGLHSKKNEHFGMAVAELIAAGSIPFVHDSGGAREIVNRDDRLLYTDTDEAVRKIDRVLSNTHIQTDIRNSLPDIEQKYGRARFRQEIREIVKHRIG